LLNQCPKGTVSTLLKIFKGDEDRKVLSGHPHIIKVVGIRDVELQLTCEKKLFLKEVVQAFEDKNEYGFPISNEQGADENHKILLKLMF